MLSTTFGFGFTTLNWKRYINQLDYELEISIAYHTIILV